MSTISIVQEKTPPNVSEQCKTKVKYHKHGVPKEYLKKLQKIADLAAGIFDVPAGLIMRVCPKQIEVLVSSHTKGNPYKSHEKTDLGTGLYCEAVMATRAPYLVPNALDKEECKNNPNVKLGMNSYLGMPLIWPDGEIFGTICVQDNKTRLYSKLYQDLLWQFKETIEHDFKIIQQNKELNQESDKRTPAEQTSKKEKIALHGAKDNVVQQSKKHTTKSKQTKNDRRTEMAMCKQSEKSLIQSYSQYRHLYENTSNANFNIWKDGRICYCNQCAGMLLGYSIEELIGMPMIDLYADTPYGKAAAAEVFRRFMAGETAIDQELQMQKTDGTTVWVSMTMIADRDNKGHMVESRSIVMDITERKRLEEEKAVIEAQRCQAQKLECIGALAGAVAHEITNPIMGIINYAQLIHDGIQDEKLKGFSKSIIREGNRVGKIVKNLLSFQNQDKQSTNPDRIEDIIDASLNLIDATLQKDQITVERDIQDDLPEIKCHSQQIQQVIMNLLTNARDALNQRYNGYHENKIIKITVRPFEKQGAVWIRTTVEDHGIGMPKDIIGRIFDPSLTTKSQAAGPVCTSPGLSVSYGIIEDHKGSLWAESKPGEYTRIHIDLQIKNVWSMKKPDTRNNSQKLIEEVG